MTNEAKSTEENKAVTEEVTQETAVEKVEKAEGLSPRDALEVAIQGTKTEKELKDEQVERKPTRDTVIRKGREKERKAGDSNRESADQGGAGEQGATESKQPSLEPPSEYTPEEKADFLALSRKGQEAQLRLDKSRKSKLDEIRSATEEHKSYKQLADTLTPYLKVHGVKEPSEVALKKAIHMWLEFENGDPKAAAAAYLQAKGIKPPKELLEASGENSLFDEKITSLQNELKEIKTRSVQNDVEAAKVVLQKAWIEFETEKNAAGKPKFPDADGNTESGLRMASSIGSLVSGQNELSKQFIANVQSRIPGLTLPRLYTEAYRYLGGRVDDSEAPRSQDSQQHIVQSRRAASSVPGKSVAPTSNGVIKKFKSRKEATAAALEQLREQEGH